MCNFDCYVADSDTGWHFEIKGDFPEVGAYLYVWDEKGRGVYDYLQDNVSMCMEQALYDYGLPIEKWKRKQ